MSVIKSLFALSLTAATIIIDIDNAAAAVDVAVNSTWPLSCDTYIGMGRNLEMDNINIDIKTGNAATGDKWVCAVFCGAEGRPSSVGPHRSTSPSGNDNHPDHVVTGIQYRLCACGARSFRMGGENIVINFINDDDDNNNTEQELVRSQKACKYEELELTLPNSVDNVSCSDVGLGVDCGDDNSGGRNNNNDCLQECSVYCREVIFKDFVSLDFVSGGYSSNAKGVCRCHWGQVTIDACTGSNTNGDISNDGGGEPSRAAITGGTLQFLVFLNIAAIASTTAGVVFL